MPNTIEKTWWVEEGRLMGGQYPGAPDAPTMQEKLAALAAAGIDTFINLQEADETGSGTEPFPDYMPAFSTLPTKSGLPATSHRFPIEDGKPPPTKPPSNRFWTASTSN